MKKSIPLSVAVAEPSPKTAFLFDHQRTWVMGVLNATPDSFYAGSRAALSGQAVRLAEVMVDEGADVIDIGGESTRPGAEDVSLHEELARVLPVIEALHERRPQVLLSIDTQKAEVARQAFARGVSLLNDISALRRDPAMAEVAAAGRGPVVLMHMRGSPRTMQEQPAYANVVDDVKNFFAERLAFAVRHQIREERMILDPGIGFGKTLEHNMSLLKHLPEFLSLGRPLLVGVSRKSFLGRLLGSAGSPLPADERLEGSIAAALWAVQSGARGLRVHDVGATRRALRFWEGIRAV